MKMKKSLLLVSSIVLLFGLSAGSAFANDSNGKQGNQLIVSVQEMNQIAASKGIEKSYTANDIPTIQEINEALQSLEVSDKNPHQTIDLGNGFSVEAGVTVTDTPIQSKNLQSAAAAGIVHNKTASGYYAVKSLGVTMFDISVSASYTYDDTPQILSVQNPISASASGNLGWSGSITNKTDYKIDKTAHDLIADAEYKYLKAVGNYSGHIEVRFTATGNWYMHDTYIGDSHYD